MKSKYLNKIILISFSLIHSAFAMEALKDHPTTSSSSSNVYVGQKYNDGLPFYIQSLHKQYQRTSKESITEKESLRANLLYELNDAINLGKITSTNQGQALSIAHEVNATNLIGRLNNYQNEDKTTNFFETLPPEIAEKIFDYVVKCFSDNEDLPYLLRLLVVSKNFTELLSFAPAFIDLRNYCEKPTYGGKTSDQILKNLIDCFPNTKSLNLSCQQHLTEEGFKHLSRLENLERLILTQTKFGSEEAAYIASLPKLNYIDFFNCEFITGESLKTLETLTKLTYLELIGTSLTEPDFQYLSAFKGLTYLDVSGLPISTKSLEYICKLTQLRTLKFAFFIPGIEINWQPITGLQNLKWLKLGAMNITDNDLHYIGSLKNLTALDLSGSRNLTTASISHIAHLTGLNYLSLPISFTEADINEIKKLLPNSLITDWLQDDWEGES